MRLLSYGAFVGWGYCGPGFFVVYRVFVVWGFCRRGFCRLRLLSAELLSPPPLERPVICPRYYKSLPYYKSLISAEYKHTYTYMHTNTENLKARVQLKLHKKGNKLRIVEDKKSGGYEITIRPKLILRRNR